MHSMKLSFLASSARTPALRTLSLKFVAWLVVVGACCNLQLVAAAPALATDVTVSEERTAKGTLVRHKMNVSPAAAPSPLMKHRLLVQPFRTVPGNAVTHYLRIYGEGSLDRIKQYSKSKFDTDEFNEILSYQMPTKDLPLQKLREFNKALDGIVEGFLLPAARCRSIDWGLYEEDFRGEKAITFLLPTVQESRFVCRLLVLRTRLAIAEKRYDDALETIKIMFSIATMVSDMKFIVCDLVSFAEIGMAQAALVELMSAEDAPNLYWAMAEVPDPIIELRDSIRLEMSFGLRLFPDLIDPEQAKHTPSQWAQIYRQTVDSLIRVSQYTYAGKTAEEVDSDLMSLGLAISNYSAAKRRLVAAGTSREDVAAMSAGQVLMIDAKNEYLKKADAYEASFYAPGTGKNQIYLAAEQALKSIELGNLGKMIASNLLPAIQSVERAQQRIQWQHRALQAVEAIRMHLAATGKLPKTIDEIDVAPVPLNPITGKNFVYWLDGSTAVLDLPFSDGVPGYSQRFEITVAK